MAIKKFIFVSFGFLASFIVSGPVQADAIGFWQTEEGKTGGYGIVQIYQCGSQYCGVLQQVIGNSDTSAVGTILIKNMSKSGSSYSGGQIYAPDEQKWYRAKMKERSPGELEVFGCVLGGLICRGQVWTRVQFDS